MTQNAINKTFLGVGAEDAFNIYLNATPQTYSHGIDTSDADSLKITTGADPSSGSIIRKFFATGERILPFQSAFSAFLSATAVGVTGDNTLYTIIFDSEDTDQNADYNNATGVYTAPVTGVYLLTATVNFGNIAAANTTGGLFVFVNGATAVAAFAVNPFAVQSATNNTQWCASTIYPMVAGDTVTVALQVSGAVPNINVNGGTFTRFAATLLC